MEAARACGLFLSWQLKRAAKTWPPVVRKRPADPTTLGSELNHVVEFASFL